MKLYKIIQINIEILVVVLLLVAPSVQLLGMKGQPVKSSSGPRIGGGTLGLKSYSTNPALFSDSNFSALKTKINKGPSYKTSQSQSAPIEQFMEQNTNPQHQLVVSGSMRRPFNKSNDFSAALKPLEQIKHPEDLSLNESKPVVVSPVFNNAQGILKPEGFISMKPKKSVRFADQNFEDLQAEPAQSSIALQPPVRSQPIISQVLLGKENNKILSDKKTAELALKTKKTKNVENQNLIGFDTIKGDKASHNASRSKLIDRDGKIMMQDDKGINHEIRFDSVAEAYYYPSNSKNKIYLNSSIKISKNQHNQILKNQHNEASKDQMKFNNKEFNSREIKSMFDSLSENSKTMSLSKIKTAIDNTLKTIKQAFKVNIADPIRRKIFLKERLKSLLKKANKEAVQEAQMFEDTIGNPVSIMTEADQLEYCLLKYQTYKEMVLLEAYFIVDPDYVAITKPLSKSIIQDILGRRKISQKDMDVISKKFNNDFIEFDENLTAVSDAYEVLNLPETATKREVMLTYRKLALQYHPDRGGNAEIFKEVSEAYQTVKKVMDDPGSVMTFKKLLTTTIQDISIVKQKYERDELSLRKLALRRLEPITNTTMASLVIEQGIATTHENGTTTFSSKNASVTVNKNGKIIALNSGIIFDSKDSFSSGKQDLIGVQGVNTLNLNKSRSIAKNVIKSDQLKREKVDLELKSRALESEKGDSPLGLKVQRDPHQVDENLINNSKDLDLKKQKKSVQKQPILKKEDTSSTPELPDRNVTAHKEIANILVDFVNIKNKQHASVYLDKIQKIINANPDLNLPEKRFVSLLDALSTSKDYFDLTGSGWKGPVTYAKNTAYWASKMNYDPNVNKAVRIMMNTLNRDPSAKLRAPNGKEWTMQDIDILKIIGVKGNPALQITPSR